MTEDDRGSVFAVTLTLKYLQYLVRGQEKKREKKKKEESLVRS